MLRHLPSSPPPPPLHESPLLSSACQDASVSACPSRWFILPRRPVIAVLSTPIPCHLQPHPVVRRVFVPCLLYSCTALHYSSINKEYLFPGSIVHAEKLFTCSLLPRKPAQYLKANFNYEQPTCILLFFYPGCCYSYF